MKTVKTSEIYKLIPKDAKSGMFILGINDSVRRFQKLVIREMRNTENNHQRAIIIFEQGISNFECKRILTKIGKALDREDIPDNAHENIHLMGRGGFTRKEIHDLLDYIKNDTETPIRIWNN